MKSILRAQGRLRKLTPVAIIDIGSNSVRLVVYEGLSRSPTPLFNEKVLCGLGTGMALTGRLHEAGVERAHATLQRFRVLAQQAGADDIYTLATAAARDAENGPAFIAKAEDILGREIHVLTGEEEAAFAAQGVQCGFQDPHGLSADMGGGSVEFLRLEGDTLKGKGITLPLGGLRLRDESGGDIAKARHIVKAALKNAKQLKEAKGQAFYAIGGTWRALGRLHMARANYPLHIMHNYEISAKEAQKLCRRLTQNRAGSIRGIEAVSSSRRGLLPYGAVLLSEIMAVMKPSSILFSAVGLREGYLYSLLPKKVRRADALVTAAEEWAVLRARSPVHAKELVDWTGRAFEAFGVSETKDEKRYRAAACMFADMTWRSHPDYRGDQALNLISNANLVGVDHSGRAYMALAIYYRHEGLVDPSVSPAILRVAKEGQAEKARLLGALFRVGYLFSAAMPGRLPHVQFRKNEGEGYDLCVPEAMAGFKGERLDRRISGLANVLNAPIHWTIAA
ncbi:MAG: Ppx/GppA phosphatase family protein [Pseudomonadota bacterium]